MPDEGEIRISGFDVLKEADKVRSIIGLTGQASAVDEYLTGEENLHMMGRLYHLSWPDIKQRSKELLELFDLVEASVRQVKNYSGGMRRRLDLALSLMASPPIIFLDEPTTGLDPPSRLMMWNTIEQLTAAGTTILLTTQDMDEADRLADRIIVIDGGKVIAEGTADELKERVGPERLEIMIAEGSDFGKAQEALDGDGVNADRKHRTVTVIVKGGVHQLKQILSRLDEAGVEVESVSFHKPTLDDVFLALTGHVVKKEGKE